VDSARLDMPVPLQRLQAHIHCVEIGEAKSGQALHSCQ
jgi:hypothetical protein